MYALAKYFHILFAVLIFGNFTSMNILFFTLKKRSRADLQGILPFMAQLGNIFAPLSGLVFLLGAWLTYMTWSFQYMWIWASMVMFVGIAIAGKRFLHPALTEAIATIAKTPQAQDNSDIQASLSKARNALLAQILLTIAIITLMVFKPQ